MRARNAARASKAGRIPHHAPNPGRSFNDLLRQPRASELDDYIDPLDYIGHDRRALGLDRMVGVPVDGEKEGRA